MEDRVPLAEAALRLGLTYHLARAKLLSGELPGGRDEFGRYYVVIPRSDERDPAADGPKQP